MSSSRTVTCWRYLGIKTFFWMSDPLLLVVVHVCTHACTRAHTCISQRLLTLPCARHFAEHFICIFPFHPKNKSSQFKTKKLSNCPKVKRLVSSRVKTLTRFIHLPSRVVWSQKTSEIILSKLERWNPVSCAVQGMCVSLFTVWLWTWASVSSICKMGIRVLNNRLLYGLNRLMLIGLTKPPHQG